MPLEGTKSQEPSAHFPLIAESFERKVGQVAQRTSLALDYVAQTLLVDFQKASSDFLDFPRFFKVNSVNFEDLTTNRFSMVEGANAAVSGIKADAVSGEVLLAPLHPPALESVTVDG